MDNFFIGMIIGAIVGSVIRLAMDLIFTGSGTLKIDRSNPNKPKYRFELDDSPESIGRKKRYILRIKHDADLSQE